MERSEKGEQVFTTETQRARRIEVRGENATVSGGGGFLLLASCFSLPPRFSLLASRFLLSLLTTLPSFLRPVAVDIVEVVTFSHGHESTVGAKLDIVELGHDRLSVQPWFIVWTMASGTKNLAVAF